MSGATAVSVAPPPQLPATRRNRTPFLIAGLSIAAVLVSGVWYLLHLGRESTDDAQVEGRVISVSARVPGQVIRVHIEDNQRVEAGDVLLELDPADFAAKADARRARPQTEPAQRSRLRRRPRRQTWSRPRAV